MTILMGVLFFGGGGATGRCVSHEFGVLVWAPQAGFRIQDSLPTPGLERGLSASAAQRPNRLSHLPPASYPSSMRILEHHLLFTTTRGRYCPLFLFERTRKTQVMTPSRICDTLLCDTECTSIKLTSEHPQSRWDPPVRPTQVTSTLNGSIWPQMISFLMYSCRFSWRQIQF